MEAQFDDRMMTIGRTAVITQRHRGRPDCHYCGPCWTGCSTGSYFSSQSVTLPAAQATGLMTLRPDSVVESVLVDPQTQRASAVRVIDRLSKEVTEFRGRLIFLCASTIASTQIMLNSISERYPNGIANDSGALGQNLMDHHFKVGARGRLPGMLDRYTEGYRPNGIYIPRFRNLDTATRAPDFLRGYGYQGGSSRLGWSGREVEGFGAALKEQLSEPGPWTMSLGAFGEMLPDASNRITLDRSRSDSWGMPLVSISCEIGENELAMRKDMRTSAEAMLEAAGATDITSSDLYQPGAIGAEAGLAIHEMGTARMGRDPATSVLNGFNQAHSVANLFVTDGSAMTSSACQNPSLTYLALTARAVDYAVDALKRRDL
jgi:choline dehydrogenase-like flavoprotein